MKKKIKILMAVNSLGIGGNVIFVMNFFRHINKDKFQVDFLIYDDTKMNFYDEVISAGSKVHIISSNKTNRILNLISQMKQVKKLLKTEHYDIVHSNSCSFLGIFRAAIPASLTKTKVTKVLSHSHNPGMPKYTMIDNIIRALFRIFLSNIVDIGLSCSDVAGSSKYTKNFIKSEKYAIIRNAIDTSKYKFDDKKRIDIRNKYNLNDKVVIGNVGRLSEQKNQKFLIDVFNEINKFNRNYCLLIIGGGELEQQLKQQVNDLNLNDSVIFIGSINNAQDYYSAMDVFVMTSIYEGLPFTAVEAQINGLKCMFSDNISKMTDILEEAKFLSLNASKEEWANCIISASENRIQPEKLKQITYDFDLKNEVKRLEKIYESLLEDR